MMTLICRIFNLKHCSFNVKILNIQSCTMELSDIEEVTKVILSEDLRRGNKTSVQQNTKRIFGDDVVKNNASPLPPQPGLPPVHPLVALYHADQKNRQANIRMILSHDQWKEDEMETCNSWNTLFENKSQLKELFLTAEIGIKENRASMARFDEIMKEEHKNQLSLQNEIKSTKEKIKEYIEIQKEFTHYVEKYKMFEDILERVAEVGDSWRNVRDILDRFETLRNTSLECARLLENELDQAADLRKQMLTLMEEKSSQLKNLTNRFIPLELQRKEARDRRVYWEHMVQRIKNTVLDRVQEAMSLNEGIHDLYRSMCKRLKIVPKISPSNLEARVDFIHQNILFYKEVVTIASGSKTVQATKGNDKEGQN